MYKTKVIVSFPSPFPGLYVQLSFFSDPNTLDHTFEEAMTCALLTAQEAHHWLLQKATGSIMNGRRKCSVGFGFPGGQFVEITPIKSF